MKSTAEHWDKIFARTEDNQLGWYEKESTTTLHWQKGWGPPLNWWRTLATRISIRMVSQGRIFTPCTEKWQVENKMFSKTQTHEFSKWQHDHVFDTGNQLAERGAKAVMWITLLMMVVEIVGGWWYNSMALLADGWHMSSHALALGLSAFAYVAARHYAHDPRFAFGTWKIEILAGYTSAILLVCVAAMMVVGSIKRLLAPQSIYYQEAMLVAAIGLVVNLLCAYILGGAHRHPEDPREGHDHHHHDLNLKSAYIHVIADAATSILAIVALAGGWLYGWAWLDPVMGIIGAALIMIWARGLIVATGKILLDREMDHGVVKEIREIIESDFPATKLADLHVWRVGKDAYSAAIVVVTHDRSLTPARVKASLGIHEEIVHATVEINPMQDVRRASAIATAGAADVMVATDLCHWHG